MRDLLAEGARERDSALSELDFAACIWVSLSPDRDAARRALAEKVAYYGSALSPLILERLELTRKDFAEICRAVVQERDIDKACALVDDRMLRIGVTGEPRELIPRLEALVEAGRPSFEFRTAARPRSSRSDKAPWPRSASLHPPRVTRLR